MCRVRRGLSAVSASSRSEVLREGRVSAHPTAALEVAYLSFNEVAE